jgi:hypothetical protein
LSTWLLLKVKNIYEVCLFPVTHVFLKLSFLESVLWIRIGFNADTDPDPAFFVNADPGTGLDPDRDPDPVFDDQKWGKFFNLLDKKLHFTYP